MIEELKIKLKSRNSDTQEPISYEIGFIVKKEKLKELMEKFTELLSFDHINNKIPNEDSVK